MNIEPGLVLSVCALILSIFSTAYNRSKDAQKDVKELEKRITALETKVEVFWKNISIDVALLLHKPHPEYKRRDELIEKYVADKLTLEELKEFVLILEDVKENCEHKQERFYASYLLNVIRSRFSFI